MNDDGSGRDPDGEESRPDTRGHKAKCKCLACREERKEEERRKNEPIDWEAIIDVFGR